MSEDQSAGSVSADKTYGERERRLSQQFQSRLSRILRNYRFCVEHVDAVLTYNQSLAAAKRVLNPKSRGKPPRQRIDPGLEVLINVRARAVCDERGANEPSITGNDVRQGAEQVTKELSPKRGRPADELLAYHVHAFLALYRQARGEDLRVSDTLDSLYQPRILSEGANVFLGKFSEINPTATTTAIVNIIKQAQKSGATDGKRYEDFFPLDGIDPSSGLPKPVPGYRLEKFEIVSPIYSS